MGVVQNEFPLPFDPAKREDPEKIRLVNTAINKENPTHLVDILERQGSIRTSMKYHAVDEDTIDIDRELAKIKTRLLRKYHMVFKDELDKNDRLDIEPLKLELIDNYDDVPPTNHMTPFATPVTSKKRRTKN